MEIDINKVKVVLLTEADDKDMAHDAMARYHKLADYVKGKKEVIHAVEYGKEWIGFIFWDEVSFGHFALRDEIIGWSKENKESRLKYVAYNSRFLVGAAMEGVPNLASKVLSLSVERLSEDYKKLYNSPKYFAETFVDPMLGHKGTCYIAAGWIEGGLTKGSIEKTENGWERTGTPKQYLYKELIKDAREHLREELPGPIISGVRPEKGSSKIQALDLNKVDFSSLKKKLEAIPDFRDDRGKRYELYPILILVVAAALSGRFGYTAVARWGEALSSNIREKFGLRCGIWPGMTTIRNILLGIDINLFEEAIYAWLMEEIKDPYLQNQLIGLDGKSLKGTAVGDKKAVHLLSVFLTDLNVTIKQKEVGEKTNEIPVAQEIIKQMPKIDPESSESTIIADALHTQVNTVEVIVDSGRDFILTVKKNQPTLYKQIQDTSPQLWSTVTETADKGHGRIEVRSIQVRDAQDGEFSFPHIKQVARVTRRRSDLHGKILSDETIFLITNKSKDIISQEQLLTLSRRYWGIENSSHHVRDVTMGEDLSTIRTGIGPRVMATLRNLAIGTLHLLGITNIAMGLDHFLLSKFSLLNALC